MWIPILVLGVGWVWLRRRAGKPILPDFLSHPFSKGAILVQTTQGTVAIPADTQVLHPTVAAVQGLLSPAATQAVAQAVAPATAGDSIHATRYLNTSPTLSGAGSASMAAAGAWANFDRDMGAGNSLTYDDVQMLRALSMQRPFHAR